MKFYLRVLIVTFATNILLSVAYSQHLAQIHGWNILSNSYEDALATIGAAKVYNINRPTLMEFDCGNEFNGQGIIANTWPGYIIKRWSDLIKRPNVIGYVARTDRYGDTHIIGTPNEILLFTLKRYTEYQKITADNIYDEFIAQKYGEKAIPFLKPAFNMAFDIVSSSLYTLGTNIANHSKMDYDPYKSSYGRHVSGKWFDPPVVYVEHDVNKEFNYWTDVIEHLAPARLKEPDEALNIEAPIVIKNNRVTAEEKMDEIFLKYVMTEKHYSVTTAEKALELVKKATPVLREADYNQVYNLFYRTLLTSRLYAATARKYHKLITETGWKEYGGVVFKN